MTPLPAIFPSKILVQDTSSKTDVPADGREPQVRWLPYQKKGPEKRRGFREHGGFSPSNPYRGPTSKKTQTTKKGILAAPFGLKKLRSRPRGYAVGAIWGHVAVLLGDASFGGGLSRRRWGAGCRRLGKPGNTLPDTNISPLKIGAPWKFGDSYWKPPSLRGYVSFRQGRFHQKVS